MRLFILFLFSFGGFAEAQSICLGINCEPDDSLPSWDRDQFGGDPGYGPIGALPGLDPDRQECIRTCTLEYYDRLDDCVAVYDTSLSPLRDSDLSACIDWAERERARCLVPTDRCQ